MYTDIHKQCKHKHRLIQKNWKEEKSFLEALKKWLVELRIKVNLLLWWGRECTREEVQTSYLVQLFIAIYYNILSSLTHNFGETERNYKMSFSKPTDNGMLQIFSYSIKRLYGALSNCSSIFHTVMTRKLWNRKTTF